MSCIIRKTFRLAIIAINVLFAIMMLSFFQCTPLVFEYPEDTTNGLELTLYGPNPYVLNLFETYVEFGAFANDSVDGDITNMITVDLANLNTCIKGKDTVIYSVTNSEGITRKSKRLVEIVSNNGLDIESPKIIILSENPETLTTNQSYIEEGAIAIDNEDDTISTKNIKIYDGDKVDTDVLGRYVVYYLVQDDAGNAAIDSLVIVVVQGEIVVVDTIAPVLNISGPNPLNVDMGSQFVEPIVTATDNIDGDITALIVKSGTVNSAVDGHYTIKYTVRDIAGNVTIATLVVNVIDASIPDTVAPVLTIANNLDTIWLNDNWSEPTVTAYDDVDGKIDPSEISKSSDVVNTSVTGIYTIIYTVSDKSNNKISDTLTVVVIEDTESPVITISGDNPLVLEIDQEYTQPTVSAVDNKDGNMTAAAIVTSGDNVITTAEAIFYVIFSVTDEAANTSSDTLVVKVLPEMPPDTIIVKNSDFGKNFPIDNITIFKMPFSGAAWCTIAAGKAAIKVDWSDAYNSGSFSVAAYGSIRKNFWNRCVYRIIPAGETTVSFKNG